MQQNILYIGLDVDDTQYHGSAFNKDTGEVIDSSISKTNVIAKISRILNSVSPYGTTDRYSLVSLSRPMLALSVQKMMWPFLSRTRSRILSPTAIGSTSTGLSCSMRTR